MRATTITRRAIITSVGRAQGKIEEEAGSRNYPVHLFARSVLQPAASALTRDRFLAADAFNGNANAGSAAVRPRLATRAARRKAQPGGGIRRKFRSGSLDSLSLFHFLSPSRGLRQICRGERASKRTNKRTRAGGVRAVREVECTSIAETSTRV